MAYGRFRRRYQSRRRTRSSRRSLRRRIRRSTRRWRRYYRRRRRVRGRNSVALSIYSSYNGLKPHFIRRKTVFPLSYNKTFYTSNEENGVFVKEGEISNYGNVTVFYIGFHFYLNYCNTDTYSPQYNAMNEYVKEYRWYKLTGVKITFIPRIAPIAAPIAGSVSTSNQSLTNTIPGVKGFVSTSQSTANQLLTGGPFYDDINMQSVGFAVPYLGHASRPWTTSVTDINKYYESGYKRLRFQPNRATSIYYRCYGGTSDNTGGNPQPSSDVLSDQIILGWRPTISSRGYPLHYDEQGLAVMVPLSWTNITVRYTVYVTLYTKFLFYKGSANT